MNGVASAWGILGSTYNCSFGGSRSEQWCVLFRGDWVTERRTWWALVCVWSNRRKRVLGIYFCRPKEKKTKNNFHRGKVKLASELQTATAYGIMKLSEMCFYIISCLRLFFLISHFYKTKVNFHWCLLSSFPALSLY